MNKCNSIETTNRTNLTEQTKFRLNEMIKIKRYFDSEINQRKSSSKKASKYVAAFDYIDKVLIVLSATSRGVCIISSVVEAPVETGGARFTLIFSLTTRITKKLLSITRKKKKNHDRILMLAKSKLNCIDTLLSQALIDMEIRHEEFTRILNEKEKYEKMKKTLRNINDKLQEKTGNMRLKSVNSRALKKAFFVIYKMYIYGIKIRKTIGAEGVTYNGKK